MKALENLRILDISRLLPGSFCSMVLGDLGAEVLKIEQPVIGDYARGFKELAPSIAGDSVIFLTVNRNKKSMTLDLKSERGRDIFYRLVKDFDVVIESFRPSKAAEMKIGYENLLKINPGIIYCSLSGYGQNGPYRERAGHDLNYLAYAGLLGMMGTPNSFPALPSVQIADIGGSLYAIISILAAVIARESMGKGQYLDISMMDSALSFSVMHSGMYFASGQAPRRGDSILTGMLPGYGVYETKDGKYICLGIAETKFWQRLCDILDLPQYKGNLYSVGIKSEEIARKLAAIFKDATRQEWLNKLEDEDICISPVNEIDEVYEKDPQVRAREMVISLDHPIAGKLRDIGSPLKMSRTPIEYKLPPPGLGEHTEQVLTSLGFLEEEIQLLRNEGII